jgi:porin
MVFFRRVANYCLIISASLLFGHTVPSLAQQGEATQKVSQAEEFKSGYKDIPSFGGPSSVGEELKEADQAKKPLLRIPAIDQALKPWFSFKKGIKEEIGLSFSMDYQALFQAVDNSPGEDNAASGLFRIYGSWTPVGHDTKNAGSLVFKAEHRHRLGTNITPQDLGFVAGSGLPTGTQFNQFVNHSWGVTNLYWQQRLADGRVAFVVGKVDPTDYLDIYGLINPLTAFSNLAFSTNPTISSPNQGLGAAAGAFVSENVYVVGGIADANGDATDEGFDTFFDDNEYFTHAEIGWTSSYERRYLDNIHVTAWHADDREEARVPESWGVAFSAAWFFDDKWMPFLRAGYADGDAPLMQATVSAGIGRYFSERRDLLGVGFNWSKPSNNALDDQYTAEIFYRFQLAQNVAITQDFQVIIDPALNPVENEIFVFGIRVRLTL